MKTGKAAGCWYIITERGKEYYPIKWRYDMRLREVLKNKLTNN